MLMVKKRSGNEEPFDVVKVRNAMAAASDEIGQPMGSGETRRIAKRVYRGFAGCESITSREVRDAVVKALWEEGYGAVADSFESKPAKTRRD